MATVPLTEQQLTEEWLVLNLENVALSGEQFIELCADNRELHFELTAQKELVIMTPPGPTTGRRNAVIFGDLEIWARKDRSGITFVPGTIFALPNGAKRAPDAAWVKRERWDRLGEEEREKKLPILYPDFVLELMSPSDTRPVRFRMLQSKMEEYIVNGVQLGWMIDPFKKTVYIYRPGQPVECLENPTQLYGDPVLPGFVFNIAELWKQ
jgi:Uma2 family endonuclease